MPREFSHIPNTSVNTNTMDSRRPPLAYQDPNSHGAGARGVSAAPPWKQTPPQAQALDAPGALTGTSFSGGTGTYHEPGQGAHSSSTYTDSATVPVSAQQAQPGLGHHRHSSRARAGTHRRHHARVRPGNNIAGGTTLRYSHDQTYNIHDRASGWQPCLPDETTWVEECEDRMRREAERLAGIINQPR